MNVDLCKLAPTNTFYGIDQPANNMNNSCTYLLQGVPSSETEKVRAKLLEAFHVGAVKGHIVTEYTRGLLISLPAQDQNVNFLTST
jgi:methyl coenzyme M reductase subunit C